MKNRQIELEIPDDRLWSNCCEAPVGVCGEGLTHWYQCSCCGDACDVIESDEIIDARLILNKE